MGAQGKHKNFLFDLVDCVTVQVLAERLKMALQLHEDLKKRLIDTLAKSLPRMEVENGMFLASRSRIALFEADNALPDHGNLRDSLNSFVDEFPLITFVYDELQSELLDLDKFNSDIPLQNLTNIEGFVDAQSLAERLIEQFSSLPWRYTFTIKLPDEVSDLLSFVSEQQLSTKLKLVKASKAFAERYPINSENKNRQKRIHGGGSLLFPKAEEANWVENAVYLQIETEGFIGPYGGSAPTSQAERLLKAFLGLGIALRMFRVDRSYLAVTPIHFYVHKANGETWKIEWKTDLSTDVSRTLNEIKLNNMIANADTDERRLGLAKLVLKEMTAVFSAGVKADAITLAAEWLLDSYGGRDDRLNYVQSMVVLEVLLGDKAAADEIGLGQLLRNRCAYLIGKNQSERYSLLKDFDDIYKVRSQIVHRGKARLSIRERILFDKLRSLCDRVIQREVDLLRAN